jgi:hypothetical protein
MGDGREQTGYGRQETGDIMQEKRKGEWGRKE